MKGFDTSAKLTKQNIADLKNAGHEFVIRYLSISGIDKNDLDSQELQDILDGGLKLLAVQHVRNPGWKPTIALGTQDANNAVQHANTIGLPKGTTIFVDIEGIAQNVSHNDIIKYCNAWFNVISKAGYTTGIYVGSNSYLTDDELYTGLTTTCYWKSASNVPDVVKRGYTIKQTTVNKTICGVNIDEDICEPDNLGGMPIFAKKTYYQVVFADPEKAKTIAQILGGTVITN